MFYKMCVVKICARISKTPCILIYYSVLDKISRRVDWCVKLDRLIRCIHKPAGILPQVVTFNYF
jgi:hypothetical protein